MHVQELETRQMRIGRHMLVQALSWMDGLQMLVGTKRRLFVAFPLSSRAAVSLISHCVIGHAREASNRRPGGPAAATVQAVAWSASTLTRGGCMRSLRHTKPRHCDHAQSKQSHMLVDHSSHPHFSGPGSTSGDCASTQTLKF